MFFPAPDGTPMFRRLASLEEAVRLVERLRNVDGVAMVSVHALTEVPLSFRAYYRVEVPPSIEVSVGAVSGGPGLEPLASADLMGAALTLVEALPSEPATEAVLEPVPVAGLGEQAGGDDAPPRPAPASLGFFA